VPVPDAEVREAEGDELTRLITLTLEERLLSNEDLDQLEALRYDPRDNGAGKRGGKLSDKKKQL
jgi:hypothetical protein